MAPLKFLRWFCKREYLIDIEGDLLEMYEKRVKEKGHRKANLLLWRDVILLFRPGMVRTPDGTYNSPSGIIRHNILISLRGFKRNKTAFFINLGSLTSGLVCALLIFLWVADELSVDKFHENDDRLYSIRANFIHSDGARLIEYTPAPLADALLAEMPEVERAVSMSPFTFTGAGIVSSGTKQVKTDGYFASKDFFKVFSYNLFLGDKSGTVISRGLATKLFGSPETAIGKMVDWNNTFRLDGPFMVTGVFEDVPVNSTSKFDIVFDFNELLKADRYANEWNASYSLTTVLLRDGVDADAFGKKIARFIEFKNPAVKQQLLLTKYSDVYLSYGGMYYVRLLSLVALFTLTIACINFVNLSTAQASMKMKEVGVKKTFGVSRFILIGQFLSESILLAFVSLGIAIGVAVLLLPAFNMLTGKHLTLHLSAWIFGLTLAAGILSGCYPAFFLSGFTPATILKGRNANSSFAEVFTRKGLVVMQFTISIIFIIGFMIVNQQIEYVQNKNLGYDKENVIRFQRQGKYDFNDYDAFMRDIKNVPGVLNAAGTFGGVVYREVSLHTGLTWEGADASVYNTPFPYPPISADYIETLGIELIQGRTFRSDIPNEETKMIVNESAVKMMGFKDPIGRIVMYGTDPKEIIGVVKDLKYGSLHRPMEPVFFEYRHINRDIVVRLAAGSPQETIEQLQLVYQKYHPGYPLDFTFLNDDYNKLYESDIKVSTLSTYFAVVATLISCFGLFGLAVFSSERRTKEIGIRKVLGATVVSIVRLLANDIVKPVLTAILIAVPVSYLIGKNWLAGFAYRIELNWWLFATAGVMALIVTWITVSIQTLKAARKNPVESLKSE